MEEKKDKSSLLHDLPHPERLIDEFFCIISDKMKSSVNILSKEQVVEVEGKHLVAITVPRASRKEKPVYIGTDMYTGTYRRNGEGDYHCNCAEIEAMLRDASDETQDERLLSDCSMQTLDFNTVKRYRAAFRFEFLPHQSIAGKNGERRGAG